jgi:hypothetical protein
MEYMHDRCPRWENIRELLITFTPPAITDITWSALQCEIEIDYMPYHRMAAEMRTRMSKILMDDTEPKLNQSQEPVVGVTWIGNFNDASTFWTGGVVPQITLEGNGDEIYTDKTYDDIQLAYLQEQPHEGSPGLYVTQAAADPFTHFFPLYFPPEEYANTKVPDVQLKLRYIGDTPKTDFQYLREVLMDQTEESIIKRVKYSDQLSPQVRNRMLRYKLSLDRYRKMSVKPRKLSRLPVYFNPMLGNDDYAAAQPVINELPPNTIMPVSPETARDENKDASPGV